jgi:hypothetical protein
LRALSAFVDESRLQPHDADDQPLIPTNSAIVFFEDKQLLAVKVRLEYERDANNMNLISLWQLAALIERVQNVEEFNVAIASVDAPYVPDTIDPSTGLPATPILDAVDGRRPSPDPVPLGEKPNSAYPDATTFPFAGPGEESSEVIRNEEDVLRSLHPTEPEGESTREVQESLISSQDVNGPNSVDASTLPDVRRSLTKAERKKFIKLLFDRDEHAYEATMNELNSLPTWQETSLFLDSLFVSLDVDPYGEPAVHLTDRMYTRFFPDQTAPAD